MTTLAPSAARRSAIARPIPREAPVTSAVFPLKRTCCVEIVHRAETRYLCVRQCPLHKTCQHSTGANLEEAIAAHLRQFLEYLNPPHWRVHLDSQFLAQRRWVQRGLRGGVRHNWHARRLEVCLLERASERAGGRSHVDGVKRSTHVER